METHIKKALVHKAEFASSNTVNKCLKLADDFLENNPNIIYWTEPNESKKGAFYIYENGLYTIRSSYEIEKILQAYIPKNKSILLPESLSDSRFQEVMKYIKRQRFYYSDFFNQENVINFKNGYLDIKTGNLIEHTPEIISTIQLPYSYDPKADCPLFLQFVNESLKGDLEKIGILQEFMGYCLIKSAKYERALFVVGEAGTGKSTLLDVIEAVMGEENCSSVRMDMLADPRYTGQLLDKYVNIDNEIPQNIDNYEDALKKVISGQKIMVNTKFLPTYAAKPFCKLIFAANDLPRISDTSNAVFRRILLLDFNNVIDTDKIDVDLKEKLKNECAGVFNWAFEGLKRLNYVGSFTTSKDMAQRVDELKLLNNSVYYFILENYEVTEKEEHWVELDIMYEEYKDFCHKVGAKGIFKKNVFGKEIKKVFINKVDQRQKRIDGINKRIWIGLRKTDNISQYSPDELSGAITWED